MATHYVNKPEIKSADALHELLRGRRENGIGKHDDIRLHRAISWLSAAEYYAEDKDIALMCYWSAYDALYKGSNFSVQKDAIRAESLGWKMEHLTKVVALDKSNDLLIIMLQGYGKYLEDIFANKYLFKGYYLYKTGDVRQWETYFLDDLKQARFAIKRKDATKLLDFSLHRLSVLRNQIIHGSATYQGSINRETLNKAIYFMSEIIPKMVEIMLRGDGWGELEFDVLDQPTDDKD